MMQRPVKTAITRWLPITVLLICATVILCVTSGCESKKERQAREEREADVAAQEVARQTKINELIAAGETSAAAGKFEEALQYYQQVLDFDPENKRAKDAQQKVNTSVLMAKVAPTKTEAEERLVQAKEVSREEGLGAMVDAGAKLVAEGDALYAAEKLEEALPKYEEAVTSLNSALSANEMRSRAQTFRTDAAKSRGDAGVAMAATDAKAIWTTALALDGEAQAAYGKADFTVASEKWQEASSAFDEAKMWAEGFQSVQIAKKLYDAALSAVADVPLDEFGGERWVQTQTYVADAGTAMVEGRWEDSIVMWESSKEWLAASIDDAKTAAEEERKRLAHLAAVASLKVALEEARTQLKAARDTPKTDSRGAELLKTAYKTLDDAQAADWFKLLKKGEDSEIAPLRAQLAIEDFHYRYPDLEVVLDAGFVSLHSLAKGSKEAVIAQVETMKNLKVPVEVKSRQTGIIMRLVPAGKFMMGAAERESKADHNEIEQHEVTISTPFYVGKVEVTQSQWERIGLENKSHFRRDDEDLPVESMEWADAKKFTEDLCLLEGTKPGLYRLPTEAEWEYACRAGTDGPYYSGHYRAHAMAAGWYRKNSEHSTQPGGMKIPNAWGIHDMHGNVWEWCLDYPRNYEAVAVTDPVGSTEDRHKVTRGGGWSDNRYDCRSANRGSVKKERKRSYDLGLRIIRELPLP